MIKPIGALNGSFNADNTLDKNGEYKDPLMKWPLRGAAFSNEIGEALRPIIGNYATLTWAPMLMYVGADIYDKYKNNETEYSPDSRRCLKQAVFQGLASVFLPLVAVKAGQKSFSQFGKMGEDKISLGTKEQISKMAEEFIAQGKMRAYHGKDEECVKNFVDRVANDLDYKNSKKIFKFFPKDKEEHVAKYSEKTIKDLIKLRKDLLNPTTQIKGGKWYAKYVNELGKGQTESVAIKSVLRNFQKGKMLKGNFIKTLGGFVALGIAIKPIDHFVEHVLIDKFVGPSIEKYLK